LTGLGLRILFQVEVIKTKTCSPKKIMKTKKIQIVFAGFSSSTAVRIKGRAGAPVSANLTTKAPRHQEQAKN
jgi:hypothetical protein